MSRDMRQIMATWARWRKGRIGAGMYWPSKTTIGKAMEGMKGTICPTCRGRDVDCPICYGTGRVRLDPGGRKINPAFVPSTFRGTDDDVSAAVDFVMCELRNSEKTFRCFLVLWAEFILPNGTQEMKAKKISNSCKTILSHDSYRSYLTRGLVMVEEAISDVLQNHKVTA